MKPIKTTMIASNKRVFMNTVVCLDVESRDSRDGNKKSDDDDVKIDDARAAKKILHLEELFFDTCEAFPKAISSGGASEAIDSHLTHL